MIKYITIFVATFLMLGCIIKTPIEKVKSKTTQIVTQKVEKITKVEKIEKVTKKPKRMTLPEGFREIKKLRAIGTNVPNKCQEWSDGCNTCSREGANQASCTIYSCETKAPFSCLKWQ